MVEPSLIAVLLRIARKLRPRQTNAAWSDILAGFTDKETRRWMEPIVEVFFKPDDIDPRAFGANFHYLLRQGIPNIGEEDYMKITEPFRTATITHFLSILDRPLGYPTWFMAAYPDIAYWLTNRADRGLSVQAAAGIDTEGPDSEAGVFDEEHKIKPEIFRHIIDYYKTHVTTELECRRVT